MNNIAIQLTNVTKTYTIHHEKPTLVEKFIKGRDEQFIALNNINLTIKKGEKVGIIGPNGSGKTTLLKILSGIASLSDGAIIINGKTVSIISLEAGFYSDLSGRENVHLNGLFVGMSRSEIIQKKNQIIKYADIGKFIDMPLYTYSQGMKLRLGFSIALHANPNIILLDENLGVGDQKFKDKLRNETRLLFNKKSTIIMASHNLYAIVDFCDRIIVLEHGKVVKDGGLDAIKYYDNNFTYEYKPPTKRRSSLISRQLMQLVK